MVNRIKPNISNIEGSTKTVTALLIGIYVEPT